MYGMPETFLGRHEQRRWLKDLHYSREFWRSPYVVSGPAGMGKSSLLASFFGSQGRRIHSLWFPVQPSVGRSLDALRELVHEEREDRSDRGRVLVLDGADTHSDDELLELFRAARNYKLVEHIYITTQREPNLEGARHLKLPGLLEEETAELFRILAETDVPDLIVTQVAEFSGGVPATIRLLAGILRTGGFDALGKALSEKTGTSLILPRVEWIDVTQQLIERLKIDWQEIFSISAEEFERLIADRLSASGCEVRRVGESNQRDGGIDIVFVTKGAHPVVGAAQVKHRRSPKGKTRPGEIREFANVINRNPFQLGIVVTNTTFTPSAKWVASNQSNLMRLRDGEDLKHWIRDKFVDEERWQPKPQRIEIAPGLFLDIPRPV